MDVEKSPSNQVITMVRFTKHGLPKRIAYVDLSKEDPDKSPPDDLTVQRMAAEIRCGTDGFKLRRPKRHRSGRIK